ncbi:rhomboid family intramembrane serine protease [Pelagimonas varians]|uniref:Rhomboid family protein n=1 Tax=Pelagimonas varians TaxID=696760 RepID=A0A238KTC1_9RHOB|nr:rhomboid family intramembrane serine protease [Pelagimonas varians]PYG28609.1 rhomboid family protein [Pelagimonas varians]SMX45392.1 Rhomboid family protein [Pelagimonas varians]
MTHPHNESPVNPLPPVVIALFLVMAGVELAFNLGERGLIGGKTSAGWRVEGWERFGFSDRVFEWMIQTGQWPIEHLIRFVAYPFIHGSFVHGMFAMVILLAMGKIVAEALGAVKFVLIYFGSAAVGALAYGVFLDDPRILIGAYPAAYGLIGGFTYFMWAKLGVLGAPQIRAFSLIGMLLFIQFIFALLFGGDNTWVAELAGFVTGLGMTVLLAPGGVAHLVSIIRRR